MVGISYPKLSTDESAATSDTIAYELVIANTGLLDVFNISATARADGVGMNGSLVCHDTGGNQVGVSTSPTEVEGIASYPNAGLPAGAFVTCVSSAVVGQTEVSCSKRTWPKMCPSPYCIDIHLSVKISVLCFLLRR